jgi:glycosyltransferase involved in cell wall biosynthesis
MRVLHITPDYFPAMGGGELFVKEISERLASRGHHVTVLTFNSRGLTHENGGPLLAADVINHVNVMRLNNVYKLHRRLFALRGVHRALGLTLGAEKSRMLSVTPCSLRAFLSTLRGHADVVAVTNWYHGSLAYQTAVARRIGRFALVGIPLFHTERPWASSPLFAQILAKCDAVLAMTQHERAFIEARSTRANAHVVGAGVDPERFRGADGQRIRARYGIGDAPLVGYVGRLSASKGVLTLINALKTVWRSDPRVRLLLAGSGLPGTTRSDDDIREAFAALSDVERSRIIGCSSFGDEEKASIFDALDVFAMPSVAESFGIAYLEAWMCRKPVIGSDMGSTACVISDGIDGRLVAPDDSQHLAAVISELVSDRRLRDRMGCAGHAKAIRSFTWEKVTDSVERVYAGACADRNTTRERARAVA